MARSPLRPCTEPRCRELVRGGRSKCAAHTRASSAERGYDAAWRKLRAEKLVDEPLCRPCKAAGRTTAATEVDHIRPLNAGGTNDWDNLQAICRVCHAEKTARETRG